jgi:hypothetical protein
MASFSRCLSAAGIRFLGILFPPTELGLPHGRLTTTSWWTRTGSPHSTSARYGRVGCPLYPGGDGVHTAIE